MLKPINRESKHTDTPRRFLPLNDLNSRIPRMVENLDTCLAKRHYPAGYDVDYFFPPVGCAKEAATIFTAHQMYFKSTKKS